MRVAPEHVEEDELPPARPARSRVPTAADADHQELVRIAKEIAARRVVGHPQDGEQAPSERLRLRRLQKVRMASQPLHSNPRTVKGNAATPPDEATADQEQQGGLVAEAEVTADTEGI